MSILEQIQDAGISKDQAIADLLRRCKVLAVRLGSQELNHWVDRELNGYAPEDSLPDYRVAKVQSRASLVGLFGRQATNIPLPLSAVPKEFRYLVEEAQLNEPIGAYEDLLRTGGKEGVYQIPWPADLIRIISTTIYEVMNIVTAWQQIPRGMIVGLVDSVRNRVLGFALELEKIAPSSDEA